MERSRGKLLLFLCVAGLLAQMAVSSASFPRASSHGGQIYTEWKQGFRGDEAHMQVFVEGEDDGFTRLQRLLLSGVTHIGYGALSADNSPCPPMSGRSYYLPNCRSATGPVNPYERGCGTITRCERDTS